MASSISSVSSSSGSTYGVNDTASRIPQKVLGQHDFMKLLAVQFQMQDPMKPKEDTEFIAQTAQFTALENSTAMTAELAQLRLDQQRVVATSYLGNQVTLDGGKDGQVTGPATAVDNSGDEPRIVVNGKAYSLSAVLRVEPSVVSAPSAASKIEGA